jgi:hypothetical protein
VLPNVRILSDREREWLRKYVGDGHTVVITGADVTQLGEVPGVIRFPDCPGKAYMSALESDFDHAQPNSQRAFLSKLKRTPVFEISAPATVATSIALVNGKPHVFFANFTGLRGSVNPVQTPLTAVRVTISGASGEKAFFLPFLGVVQELKGVQAEGSVSYVLPAIAKGAVFWYEVPGRQP